MAFPAWLKVTTQVPVAAVIVTVATLIEHGPVTPKEIAAFKEHMRGVTFRGDNNHNNFVYGNGGDAAESLGDMYEITQDRDFLDQLIGVADKMLAGLRNAFGGHAVKKA